MLQLEFSWQMIMLIHLSIATCGTIVFKTLANEYFKKKGIANALLVQYSVAAVAAISYKTIFDQGIIPLNILLMVASVGAVNAWGAYYQWHSNAFSLSRTALASPLQNIITISLAVIFLNEVKIWNYYLLLGVILAIIGPILYPTEKKDAVRQRLWMFYISAVIIIFGISQFAMKAFASFAQMPMETGKVPLGIPLSDFLFSFYIGAFLSSVLIFRLKKGDDVKMEKRSLVLISLLGLSIISTSATLYWALSLAEASKITPIQSSGLAIGSVLIGLLGFGEAKKMINTESPNGSTTKTIRNKKILIRRVLSLAASIIGVALILTSR